MSNLSLEEFNKLSEEEKCYRYKELSDHDKFLVRVSMPIEGEVVGYVEISKQERIESLKQLLDAMIEFGEITKEEAKDVYKREVKNIEDK